MKKILIYLSMIALFSSCETEESTEAYHGEWFLVGIENPFVGQTTSYEAGQIIWDFDTSNQIIEITNNTDSPIIIYPEGFHSYTFGEHDCNYVDYQFITVSEEELGVFNTQSLGDDILKIDYSCVDGSILHFER